ncbi:GntR family transcriptional regulator [Pseudonocardia eucalypti]|uniref:GntR family transcriptional regulator n=1 Tax=Pseudonocardia eucalypti TaxID=648755 RepID=A0ABP9R9G2_9PSEU|nr:DNA-binding GntR family transcriptional regulator [Pseudonocardia eucalypti]
MTGGVNHSFPGRTPLLADRAYDALRDMIVTLRLPPGTPINEERLSAELGVGRTPLRDALKRLEAESLVLIYPRRGTFVTEVNITDHGLIADVRRQLEGHAARRAAERLTAADRARLAELLETVRDRAGTLDRAGGMRLDTEIHRAVYACAHNRYLEATLEHYYNLSLRIWYLFLERLPEVDHTGHMSPLIEAILAGDPERAHRLAVRHVDEFEQSVREAI